MFLGDLGDRRHWRCRNCGTDWSSALVDRAGIPQIAREIGVGEEYAGVLEKVAVRRGVWAIREDLPATGPEEGPR